MDSRTSGATGTHVLRLLNMSAVLAPLRPGAPLRLTDLSEATGLSRPAVTRATDALAGLGWVEYLQADSDGQRIGRPAQLVRFRAEAGYVLGIDIGPHKILTVVADLAGEIVARERADTSLIQGGPELVSELQSCVERAMKTAQVATEDVRSVTVGTPGIVDQSSGTVGLVPSMPGWTGADLMTGLRAKFNCPWRVDNDVKLAVQGERWRGVATDADTVVFVQWGARVGAAIMIGSHVHRGVSNDAGDLGFLDLSLPADHEQGDFRSRQVADGRGPFERVVGTRAILELALTEATRAHDEALQRQVCAAQRRSDVAPLFAAAEAGNIVAQSVVDMISARFAAGIAAVRVMLDPDLVIIGGGVSKAGPPLLDAVRRHLDRHVLVCRRVELSMLGDDAVAMGGVRASLDVADEQVLP